MEGKNMDSGCQFNFEAISTQRSRLLNRLRSRDVSTIEARKMGIMSPAARILELRRKGYEIETKKCEVASTENAVTSVALYCLTGEPVKVKTTNCEN